MFQWKTLLADLVYSGRQKQILSVLRDDQKPYLTQVWYLAQ